MFKIGDRVLHYEYGEGEITTSINKDGLISVAFEKEFEVLVGKITDTDYYFHDDRRLEFSQFIDVHPRELEKLTGNPKIKHFILKERSPNCHSCKKLISSRTHSKCSCGWLKCDCGSCGCDYPKHP